MVDRPLLAKKVAAVGDAVSRIRSVLPATEEDFLADRTAREVVALNLFVAIQDCIDLAAHWLADEGWDVPGSYRDVLAVLAEHGVVERRLADSLSAATGLRNLVVHRYGVHDRRRVYALASGSLGDLERFCAALAAKTQETA